MTVAVVPVGMKHAAFVDAADLTLVLGHRWHPLRLRNGRVYAATNETVGGLRRIAYMHRLIVGTPKGMETDHRDGNGLNNQRSNLRAATPGQNRVNSGKPKRPDGGQHSSQFKGVTWHATRGKWQAKIHRSGRSVSLGRFVDEVDAARAYDLAAIEEYGDFARLNFPEIGAS